MESLSAKELRIGNYYAIAETHGVVYPQVKELKYNEFGNLSSGNHNLELAAKPIPLTEEWLLKFNAKKISDGVFAYSRFQIRFLEAYNYWYVIEIIDKAYITKVEFVHEWQNLIFTLDGQELTLNQ